MPIFRVGGLGESADLALRDSPVRHPADSLVGFVEINPAWLAFEVAQRRADIRRQRRRTYPLLRAGRCGLRLYHLAVCVLQRDGGKTAPYSEFPALQLHDEETLSGRAILDELDHCAVRDGIGIHGHRHVEHTEKTLYCLVDLHRAGKPIEC